MLSMQQQTDVPLMRYLIQLFNLTRVPCLSANPLDILLDYFRSGTTSDFS